MTTNIQVKYTLLGNHKPVKFVTKKRAFFGFILTLGIVPYLLKDRKYLSSDQEPVNCFLDKVWNDGKTLLEMDIDELLRTVPVENRIFFHETSCFDDGVITLRPRQACAIESTAYLNPDHEIFLLFTSQVGYRNKSQLRIIDELLSYKNVHINFLNISSYTKDTPIEQWMETKELFRSKYKIQHTADILRLVTMYKYGGTYLDLDIICLRPLNFLNGYNSVGAESSAFLANGVMHFEGSNGSEIASIILKQISKDFNGTAWSYNGPIVLTKVAMDLCETDKVWEMIDFNDCRYNFKVLPEYVLYSVPGPEVMKYFDPECIGDVMTRIYDSALTHISNSASGHLKLLKTDEVAYIYLAKKFCPKVFEVSDDF